MYFGKRKFFNLRIEVFFVYRITGFVFIFRFNAYIGVLILLLFSIYGFYIVNDFYRDLFSLMFLFYLLLILFFF